MNKWIRLLADVGERKKGAVIECPENTARAYVDAGLAEEAEAPTPEIQAAVAAEIRSVGLQLAQQAAQELRSGMQAGLRRPGVGHADVEVVEDEADKPARSIGGWFRNAIVATCSAFSAEERQEAHNRLVAKWSGGGYGVRRGMTEAGGAAGGYTTPVLYESQVFQIAAEMGVIVPGCSVKPLGARTVEWPSLNQYAAPTAGQSAYFGGVTVSRKNETAQRSASAPTFAKVSMTTVDLTAYTEISRDLLQDSTAVLDSMVPDLMGRAIGWREDWECINGTGSGQFLGINNAPATISFTRTTSNHIKYQDVFGMYVRLHSAGKSRAVWIVHPYTVAELLQIQDAAGRFIMLPYYSGSEGALQVPFTYRMLGLPVLESEKAPVLGSAGDLMLVDRMGYFLGRRSGLEIGVSEHFKFDTDQLAIRAKVRNDGQPGWKKAITLADGTDTVSFAVNLAA